MFGLTSWYEVLTHTERTHSLQKFFGIDLDFIKIFCGNNWVSWNMQALNFRSTPELVARWWTTSCELKSKNHLVKIDQKFAQIILNNLPILVLVHSKYRWIMINYLFKSIPVVGFVCDLPTMLQGRLCEKCDGKCVICDSYVAWTAWIRRMFILVRSKPVPSGNLTKNYGKSPFLMGKLTINGHFQ